MICSEEGCSNTATFSYKLPGRVGTHYCCAPHMPNVMHKANTHGYPVELHPMPWDEPEPAKPEDAGPTIGD